MSYPKEQQSTKPVKAVAKTKVGSSMPTPFDPEELSQRLFVVLAEQKAYAEKKRRAKAIATRQQQIAALPTSSSTANPGSSRVWASGPTALSGEPAEGPITMVPTRDSRERSQVAGTHQPCSKTPTVDLTRTRSAAHRAQRVKAAKQPTAEKAEYHHVPQVAAAQFALTTTAGGMTERGLVHKFSKKALKLHLSTQNTEKSRVPADAVPVSPQEARALRRAKSHRERLHEREQTRATHALDTAIEEDEEWALKQQHRHTIEGPLRGQEHDNNVGRRKSTGELLAKHETKASSVTSAPDAIGISEHPVADPETVHEHRVDWTQSDEPNLKHKSRMTPLLRKADSIWTLRGRLGSLTRHGRDDKAEPSIIEERPSSAATTPKSPKAGFFARFKVNH